MIKEEIIKAIAEVTGIPSEQIVVETPSDTKHGDYSSNVALQSGGSPRLNAEKIVGKLLEVDGLKQFVSDIQIAGPGFINFTISKNYLVKLAKDINDKNDNYGASELGKGKTIVIDYSAPNIAKRFSIGHLRSTIIGQALYNVYKKLGYKVIGDNHLGDWGTQFGVLIYMVETKKLEPENLTIEEWEKLYVEFHEQLELTPELKDEAKRAFKRLEDREENAHKIWQAAYKTSMVEYQKIYDLLGVSIDYTYGESFYEDKMADVIEEFRSKSLSKKSEGAEIVEFADLPPAMLVKSDETTTYFTRDLATIKYRINTWKPDTIMYEVGSDQILHFRQVFAAARLVNWDDNIHFEHVAHGMIRLPEGKMSTRKGRTIKLEEVLNKAIEKAKEVSKSDNQKLNEQIGVGAIKYYDLMHSPTSEIVFDWDKMFVLTGNSGPYIQYTYARTQSLLEKGNWRGIKDDEIGTGADRLTEEEVGVLRQLLHYPEIVETVGKMYTPNILVNYLYDLASSFNAFYNANKVVGGENELFRLALTSATAIVIRNSLELLGIESPEKM